MSVNYTVSRDLKWVAKRTQSVRSFCLCVVSLSLVPILYFTKSTREKQELHSSSKYIPAQSKASPETRP